MTVHRPRQLADFITQTRATREEFRRMMACWPTGAAVVTSSSAGSPVGCTVSAITSISLEPPLLLVSLGVESRTLAAARELGRFGVNVLSSAQGDLAPRFARGDPAERFNGVDYVWMLGVPLFLDSVISAVCVVERRIAVADHVLVVATPIWQTEDLDGRPTVCFRHTYWKITERGTSSAWS